METTVEESMRTLPSRGSRTGGCIQTLCRSVLPMLGKLGILLPVLFGAHQMLMTVRAEDSARIEAAERYIEKYEEKYIFYANSIDDLFWQAWEQSGPAGRAPDRKAFRSHIRTAFTAREDEDHGFSLLYAHFRATLRCVDAGRCDAGRIRQIYEIPVCSFHENWQSVVNDTGTQAKWHGRNLGEYLGQLDWSC